nr:rhodanese-like domain-containing protein [uncultured Desulfobacter sp.]
MSLQHVKKILFSIICISLFFAPMLQTVSAQDVNKGEIPEEYLSPDYTKLPWGSPVWDEDEAIKALKKNENILWVDTRPESFFKTGTVSGAVLLVYHKKGVAENTLTEASLEKAIADAGLSKDTVTVVFFCQGPQCHMSYNATQVAINDWGYSPEKIVWFRAGYPGLFQMVKDSPKLKRKAKKYLSQEGINRL